MFMSTNKDAYSQQYNSYAIPRLVPFWTKLSCWHKICSNKTTLYTRLKSSLQTFRCRYHKLFHSSTTCTLLQGLFLSEQSSVLDTKAAQTRLIFYQVKVIATNILRSSSRATWQLQNIHSSNDNASIPVYIYFSITTNNTFTGLDYQLHGGTT